eukprot:CAMPEP_0117682656 /NCGR_PEP_ID=MMETSP0804-20121206/19823_1 /TAXON_ID=1074897 /ORGANISM="Tetraselmis astigmatica, Strain CCMP880" /LENGTH=539 /DNA_ID=CAMNT_0005492877 /DNA_START=46 /DNA_END=1662 /DNA_ORIENTATION=-
MRSLPVAAALLLPVVLAAAAGLAEGIERQRPERFYKWPLSKIAGDAKGSRWDHRSGMERPRRASSGRSRMGTDPRRMGSSLRDGGSRKPEILTGIEEPAQVERLPAYGSTAPEAEPVRKEPDFSKMRYWTERLRMAPQDPLPITDKFLSFEPWNGGFNNIRMSLELAMSLAIATNRTLVLPDNYNMYKLPGVNAWSDFFDIDDMARGVPIMHQRDFLAKFNLPNRDGRVTFPNKPGGWSAKHYTDRGWQGIWEISQSYGFGEDIGGKGQQANVMYCVPDCPKEGSEYYQDFYTHAYLPHRHKFMPHVSTSSWDNAQIVHFSQNGLGHWYTSIFIRPKSLDIKHKLAMRTHCHFNDQIFDLAEKVLRSLLAGAPSFSCTHVRRGDFQFKEVWTPVEQILSNTASLFHEDEHLWVMTEEKQPHEFFADLKDRYKLHFLNDYMHLLEGVNKAIIPMIESVICSRGRVFSGTYLSTLSGYITRLRGYMEDIHDKNVYFNQMMYPGDYKDWDTKFPTWKNARSPKSGGVPGWSREYKEAWDMEW